MTAFNHLSGNEIDLINNYIRNETAKAGLVSNYDPISASLDSCRIYDSLIKVVKQLKEKREQLTGDADSMVRFDRQAVPPTADTTGLPLKVSPKNYNALYYTFEINTFGWFNVDILLQKITGNAESKLIVRITGAYADRMKVYIVIPAYKAFEEGGELNDDTRLFGFYRNDGLIPLPPQTAVTVFAVSEREEGVAFGYQQFTSTADQTITLIPQIISRDAFNQSISKLTYSGISIKAEDTKISADLRKTGADIKSAEALLKKLKPDNCNCHCGEVSPPILDTTEGKDLRRK